MMSVHCCQTPGLDRHRNKAAYRKVLWTVLAINAGMFVVELAMGLAAGSVSLQADALDFLGDAANYGISLLVAGLALHHRARAALLKGVTMGAFGLWILGSVVWHASRGTVPEATTMGTVGFAALVANALTFILLWAYRSGDSNMQSVWLCSRNDVIGNCAVLLAAAGVFGTSQGWPDLMVAMVMGALAIQGAWIVARSASRELAGARA
jgi:Co/Zn/Cd efflux system component